MDFTQLLSQIRFQFVGRSGVQRRNGGEGTVA